MKHGNGTDIFSNGDIYIGHYKDGKPDGYGQYIWSNGSSYVGYFKDGFKHGKGKWKMSKGTVSNTYEGEYYNDVKQGEGVFRWASGNVYVGRYKNDERDGYGEMIWTDGSKYVGEWKNGIQNGYGKMLFPNGTVKEGYFDNNIFKGKTKPEEEPFVDKEVRLNSKIDTIEQENLWERYGQTRKPKKQNKNLSETIHTGNGWYPEKGSLPDINASTNAYENDSYAYNAMNATDLSTIKRRQQNTISHTQISFNRGRTKNPGDNLRQKFHSNKRPRVSTATNSSVVKRRNLNTTSTEVKRKKPNIPKFVIQAK